jgi:hypothetical protein
MTGYLDYDEYPDDLDTPVEQLRGELWAAGDAVEALTVELDAFATTGTAADLIHKAEHHRDALAGLISWAGETAELVEANPHTEAGLAVELADLRWSLAEDTETALGWVHYLQAAARARRNDAAIDHLDDLIEQHRRTVTLTLWAALLAAKSARTAEHLTYARRVHLRALTAVRCRPGRKAPRPRTPDARRRRCQLAHMVTASTDDPLPARGARCPTREPLSRLAPTHERPGAPTGP